MKLEIQKIQSNAGSTQYIIVKPIVPTHTLAIGERNFINNTEVLAIEPIPSLNEKTEQYIITLKNSQEVYRLKEGVIANMIPGDMPCLPPWVFADEDLNSQLEKEISPTHILFRKDVKTIARREDNDDVLFAVSDADFQYANVHLTWSSSRSTDATYPRTTTFKDWADVYENLFVPDNRDYDL